MKLLCVVPSYWPAFQYGGPIASNHNLNRALVKKRVDVTVYTTNVGLNKKVPINQEVDVDGVKVTYFAFTKFFEFLGATGWQFSLELTHALKKSLKSMDLIYLPAVWNYPTTVAAYYCRKYRKPYIIAPRGVLYPYTKGKNAWKKWLYYELLAKRNLQGAVAIHYTTEDEADKCHSFLVLKNQAIVIPNGIDLSEFSNLLTKENLWRVYPILKDKKVILFLGRINWKKGLDLLSKAYGRLARERDDVHLLMVGPDEGGYERKVKKWLKDEGVLERVTFAGMLTGKEKLEAFSGSDIFVFPSYSENFGMAVVEAMACGLPVVISDQVGIHKEVERAKAGLIIHPNSGDFYAAMVNLLNNGKEVQQMGVRGRSLVEEEFAIKKVADRMIKIFEEIIK
ncbi:MAG: glycosyltransferase [Candidatus Atribacteria bacterium]